MEDFNKASDYSSDFKRLIRSGRKIANQLKTAIIDELVVLQTTIAAEDPQTKKELRDILAESGINLAQANSLINLWVIEGEHLSKTFIDFRFNDDDVEQGT